MKLIALIIPISFMASNTSLALLADCSQFAAVSFFPPGNEENYLNLGTLLMGGSIFIELSSLYVLLKLPHRRKGRFAEEKRTMG